MESRKDLLHYAYCHIKGKIIRNKNLQCILLKMFWVQTVSFLYWWKCCLAPFPPLSSVSSSTIKDAATTVWFRMHCRHSLAKANGKQNCCCSLSTVVYSNLFFGGCIINIVHMNVWGLAGEAHGSFWCMSPCAWSVPVTGRRRHWCH